MSSRESKGSAMRRDLFDDDGSILHDFVSMGLTEGRNGYRSSHQCNEKYGQGEGGHDHSRLHCVRILVRVISIPLMSEACDGQSLK
jgi:hypothetical protein